MAGTDVTGLGEMMAIADGSTPTSLTMMIRGPLPLLRFFPVSQYLLERAQKCGAPKCGVKLAMCATCMWRAFNTARVCPRLAAGGSTNGKFNHALAHSADGGDTWGKASVVFIAGVTCQGSIGRDSSAPPGHVLLTAPGSSRAYLGRGNLQLYTLSETQPGADVVKKMTVWPQAAGYSDFAQVKSTPAVEDGGAAGPVLLLFEAGTNTYDQGIMISQV